MKKKIRIIALTMAFCIVFAISASAMQVDAVHAYNYFGDLTDISCHGYLYSSDIPPMNIGEPITVWASTEISHPVDVIIKMSVTCWYTEVTGAPYGYAYDEKLMTGTDTIVSLYDTPIATSCIYGYLEGYHYVEYEDPGSTEWEVWDDRTYANLF